MKAHAMFTIFCFTCSLLFSQFAGGTGTEADPWQVATAEQLNNVRNYLGSTHSDKYFVQTADINLGVAPWNQGAGWVPIATAIPYGFYGNYNGNGQIIPNLYINRPNTNYQGLFGILFGSVSNLGLDNIIVHGHDFTGGLVVDNRGTISNCYSTGSVSGNEYTGGLVGRSGGGTISNCYSTGSVNGSNYTGGLVGDFSGTLSNCYSTGSVSGIGNYTGGLVGSGSGTISNCYWDTQTSGQSSSAVGEGRTSDEMTWPHSADTYVNWDWRIWKPDVAHSVNNGYLYFRPGNEVATQVPEAAINPYPVDLATTVPVDYLLSWQAGFSLTNTDPPTGFRLWLGTDNPPSNMAEGLDLGYTNNYDPDPDLSVSTTYYWRIVPYNLIGYAPNCPVWSFTTYNTIGFAGGSGTISDPWQIATVEQLYNVRYYLGDANSDKHFIQTADLDLGIAPWNQGEGWRPIGPNFNNRFFGHYDGDGHIISNLYINQFNSGQLGLFGYIVGSISNLGVEEVNIIASSYAGGLIGKSSGTVDNCYSTGVVNGNAWIGGLVGYHSIGTINNCYSSCSVIGYNTTGGLVGGNFGTISYCNSNGTVRGYGQTGGLVAVNDVGTISNCYSAASVSGYTAGGLVGINNNTISNCYSTGAVSGIGMTGGLVADNRGTVNRCYSTSAVSSSGIYTGGLVGYAYSGNVYQSFWDTQSSGQTTSAGGTGSTTEEMAYPHAVTSYVGWDWRIWIPDVAHTINGGYPYLRATSDVPIQIPEAAINPLPPHQGTSIPRQSSLSWQVGFSPTNTDPPDGFRIWLGTNNPPSNILNGVDLGYTNSFDPSPDLNLGTTYYWRVIPYNQIGDAVNCPIWSFTTLQTQGFAGGSGTDVDPWQIVNAEHLYNVRLYTGGSHSNKYFIQMADIDLGAEPWNQGEGWVPIGLDYSNRFSGHYNGNGHLISNLYINRPDGSYQGLFGLTTGTVTNLGVANVNVRGYYCTGAIAGYNYSGTISYCYSAGVVNGFSRTGGLVGYNLNTVIHCYSSVNVNGNNRTGGLIGVNSLTISYCFSTGTVSGNGDYIGGFTGYNAGSSNNCYWDIQQSGQSYSGGNEGGRSTEEMTWPYATNTFVNWDFTNIWTEDPPAIANEGYPYLLSQMTQVPNPAVNPHPSDLATGIPVDSILSWQADYVPYSHNPPTGFRIHLGTDNPPTNILNGLDLAGSLFYNPDLSWAEETTYYWQLVPYNRLGDAENCPVWLFSTNTAPHAEINTSQISFGNVWIDHSATKSFTVSNLGAQNLELTMFISAGAFTVTTTDRYIGRSGQLGLRSKGSRATRDEINLTVPPMSTETVYVNFLPTAQQQYSSNLFIETNAPNLPSATIPLSGTGYILYAGFQANPDTGDVPLEVSFTNQSVAGITQCLWDFGDGSSSDESNPTHTFLLEGVYPVQLTVWDDYFSTSATHPVTVIAHPMLGTDQMGGYAFSKTYLDEVSPPFEITLNSTGTDTLYVTDVYWSSQNRDSYFHYDFDGLGSPIIPGGNVSLSVIFAPLTEGVFADTLCIINNSENHPLLEIPFSGRGYLLHAGFSYEPQSGDLPLTVTFTDASTEDIIQWSWDFGDGNSSTQQDPVHVFEVEGLYQVELTVSDGVHFDSVSHSVGVIAHALMACADLLIHNFDIVYLGDTSAAYTLTLQSTGTDTLYVNNIWLKNGSPEFSFTCPDLLSPILPGGFTTVDIWFHPSIQGAFSDSLIIETNAENLPVLKVKVSGRGEYVPPKPPSNVTIVMNGYDAVISWDAVTQTIYNTPFVPDGYLVFYNGNPDPMNDPYYYLAVTTELSHTHVRVGEFAQHMFYRVIAYKYYGRGEPDLSSWGLTPGMPEAEVLKLLP